MLQAGVTGTHRAAATAAHDVAVQARAARAELLSDLDALVRHDSPSHDRAAVDGLARELADWLSELGFAVELVEADAGLHVHAHLAGDGSSHVALLCHHDTVFPLGTAAARPLTVAGEIARGPGVADMKGGIVVAAHAARLAVARHPGAVGRLELVSVPDEEPRSAPFATLGRLTGVDAVLCMECGRPGNGIVTRRKGGRWLELTAHGRAAHAGADAAAGRNAVVAACAEALRVAALDGARDGLGVHVTGVAGGESMNSIPERARVSVDVRGWSAADLDWALAAVRRFGSHRDVALDVVVSDDTPPLERTAAVAGLAEAAAALADALGQPVVEASTGGVSDACWTAAAGLPTLDGLGPVGGGDHGPGEYIEVPSLAGRCGLVAGLAAAVEATVAEAAR